MFRRYGEVYIKPASGGQGKGVSWSEGARRVPLLQERGGPTRRGRVATVAALAARRRYRGRAMLVQQAIPVLTYRRRVFDVRALVAAQGGRRVGAHRDGRPPRRSQQEGDQHPRRGKALPLETVLEESGAGPDVIEGVRARVEELALAAANAVARSSAARRGSSASTSPSTKSTAAGRSSVNSRTGRISVSPRRDEEEARKADQGPAAYARFLAGKRPGTVSRAAHSLAKR